MKKQYTGFVAIAAVCAIAAGLTVFTGCAKKTATTGKTTYVTKEITRGAIEKTVSSSGSLEPVSKVNVISQMSGTAEKVNADYNDHVTKGQVLVELNTSMLKLQLEQKKADVVKAQANYELQKLNYANQVKLAEKGLVSDLELKTSKTNLDVNAASLNAVAASLKEIETEISDYAFIKAPITGIVLSRGVEVGQTVVGASSNSSALFTICEDLTKMQIQATVDEIDIASIHKGQAVKFTVEAQPGKSYSGKVQMVRLVPKTSDNVVSYYVIITVDNADGSLLPGMTADISFIVSSTKDALLVPNAALRYEPTTLTSSEIADAVFKASLSGLTEEERNAALAKKDAPPAGANGAGGSTAGNKQSGLASLVMGSAPRGMPSGGPGGPGGFGGSGNRSSSRSKTSASANGAGAAQNAGAEESVSKNIWYLDDSGKLAVMTVKTGVTDGSNTEIISDQDLEGKKIIVKEQVK
jgi:HlyD family secretion protein